MEITNEQKQNISELARKHGLSLVVLFGSQATGKTHPKSDVDIGVAKRRSSVEGAEVPIIEIESELVVILKRDDVEVVNIYNVSPTLMRSVVEEGKALYESSPDEFSEWKLYAIRVWMETNWLRERARAHLKEWAKQL